MDLCGLCSNPGRHRRALQLFYNALMLLHLRPRFSFRTYVEGFDFGGEASAPVLQVSRCSFCVLVAPDVKLSACKCSHYVRRSVRDSGGGHEYTATSASQKIKQCV